MEWKIILRKRNTLIAVLLLLLLMMVLFWFQTSDIVDQQEENQQYVEEFHEKIESVVEQADSIGTISIFSQNDSFSGRNLIKTQNDFSNLLEIEPVVFDGRFLIEFFSFSMTNIFVIAASLFIVFAFSNEAKLGLKSMIFSTVNGRSCLALRKVTALLWWDAILVVVFYGMTLLLCCLRYQSGIIESLAYPLQSITLFWDFPWKVNIGTFLLVYFLYRWLILFLITLIAWVILCCMDQLLLAVGTICTIGILNFLIYQLVGSNHPLSFLHYCNFWYLMKDASFFTEYKNLNLFSYAVNKNVVITGVYIFFIIVFLWCAIWIGEHKYPYAWKSRRIERWLVKVSRKLQSLFGVFQEKLSLLGAEYYKLLISQKGLVVILVLFVVLVCQTDLTKVQRSGSQDLYYDFLERYMGEPNEQSQQELDELSETIAEVDAEYEKKCEMYEKGELSAEEYMNIVQKNELYVQDRIFLKQIQEQTEYLQNLKEERNISAWYVNEYSYAHLLRVGDTLWNLFLILGIVLLGSGIFSWEKRCGITEIIRGSAVGRKEFFWYKIAAIFSIIAVIYIIVTLFEIGAVKSVYGLQGLAAPVQSVEQLSFVTLSCSIGTFFCILYLAKGILLLALAAIVSAISLRFSQKTAIVLVLILCIPTLLTTAGFTGFRYISLTEILSIAPFLVQTQNMLLMSISGDVFMVVALWCIGCAYKKWCIT